MQKLDLLSKIQHLILWILRAQRGNIYWLAVLETPTKIKYLLKLIYLVVLLLSHDRLFYNPMNCSLPGSSVHAISWTRLLE